MLAAKFYETYYFCNVIRNILHDQFSYIRNLNDFYGDGRIFGLTAPFQKYSVFHHFIEFIVDDIYYEQITELDVEKRRDLIRKFSDVPMAIREIKPDVLPIETALTFYSIEHESFLNFLKRLNLNFQNFSGDDLFNYYSELRDSGTYEKLLFQTVYEVFHILFQNRSLLMIFNEMLSRNLEPFTPDNISCDERSNFTKKGTLKRSYIPKWAQRAVYFRDRGRCVLCSKDLSGLVSLGNVENYDHIVPLAQYGFNDISNLQLLCRECNQIEKRDRHTITSEQYESWYRYDET